MKPSDALRLVALVERRWASLRLTDAQRQQFATDLGDLDAASVAAAVDVLHRRGGEFAPTAGAIRRCVVELEFAPPDWAEVKRSLIDRHVAVQSWTPPEWTCPYDECDGSGWTEADLDEPGDWAAKCRCYEQRAASRRMAETLHPLVREFIEARFVSWSEVEQVGVAAGTREATTLEAQMRGKWEAFVARAVQSRAVASVGVAPELRALEEARVEDARRGDLRRIDPSRLLPSAT